MRTNIAKKQPLGHTHEGAPAARMTDLQALKRSVMSCLLWEREFYEDGQSIADRIVELSAKVRPEDLASLAIEARHSMHLRHVPLLLLNELTKHGKGKMVGDTIFSVISRADEPAELLSIYWGKQKHPMSAQLKRGLALSFAKFKEYHLQKYNRDGAVKLRDVLFLSHAKPADEYRKELYKRLIDGTMATPDTWETELSAGKDKRETFERLIAEDKLGYFALLRNLRNMHEAGVSRETVMNAILARNGGAEKVLPFRYIAAARAAPQYETAIDKALLLRISELPALKGTTGVLVDVSGSMEVKMSGKSDLLRIDAASALASIINGDRRVFSFSDGVVEVPPRSGMAGVDAIIKSQVHSGTYLGRAVEQIDKMGFDRLIVITDEQSHDRVTQSPKTKHAYMINVASNKNGVGYGAWKHIDGFSENVIAWIHEIES